MSHLAIVILGAINDEHGHLGSLGRERCLRAIQEYHLHPGAKLLPTGGWGDHFNTTAQPHHAYLRQLLIAQGIPENTIVEGADSKNTIEDAALARPIIQRHGFDHLIIVTSDFHLPRARFLFTREFPRLPLTFVGSPTNLPAEELSRRIAHEESALQRLQATAAQ